MSGGLQGKVIRTLGWSHEDQPAHAGHIIGQAWKNGRWSDVGPAGDSGGALDVETVQASCACGWRSARYRAPFGTALTSSGSIDLPTSRIGLRKKDGLRRLWLEHVSAIGQSTAHEEIDNLGEPVIES